MIPTVYTQGALFAPIMPADAFAQSGVVGGGRQIVTGGTFGVQPPATVVLQGAFQGSPNVSLSGNVYVYRPFGAASPTAGPIAALITPDFECGRGGFSGGNYLIWSDFVDLPAGTDVRDGVTRSAGFDSLTYADGDEVRIGSTSGSRYAVVWVVPVQVGTTSYKRAYLLRAQAVWPGPF